MKILKEFTQCTIRYNTEIQKQTSNTEQIEFHQNKDKK